MPLGDDVDLRVSTNAPYRHGERLHVVLDEAFEPFRAVGAVVLTDQEFEDANEHISDLRTELLQSAYLAGLKSFDEFVDDGFHGTADTAEVTIHFVDKVFKVLPGKAYIYFTDGSRRPDLSDKKTVLLLYASLLQVLIRTYRRAQDIELHFEQHEELGKYFQGVADVARAKSRGRMIVKVHICPKGDPPSLALADYLLWIFGRSYKLLLRGDGLPQTSLDARNLRAARNHFSLIYSLETGRVANRRHPVIT